MFDSRAKNERSRWVAAMALVLASTVSRTAAAPEIGALAFIIEMMSGIEARIVDCPVEIRLETSVRQMGVVCASFDGKFERFRDRWDARHELRLREGYPAVTAWESDGDTHDRLYARGETVVGVRFREGDLVIVYK